MTKTIRKLTLQDYNQVLAMETGIEDDYILPIFDRLIVSPNVLYGLFVNEDLICLAGFTIYEKSYAMLGRLRSNVKYRGQGHATELMKFILGEALRLQDIKWIGANTEEKNIPARRLLNKLGLTPFPKLYAATVQDLSRLQTGAKKWKPIHELKRKKELLYEHYIRDKRVFPYECYYPFPSSEQLFPDDLIKQWSFFEDEKKNRFVITKKSKIGNMYLHTIYPWDDLLEDRKSVV